MYFLSVCITATAHENFRPGDSHGVSVWQESGLGLAIYFSLSSEETKAHTSVCPLAPLSAVPVRRDEKEPVSVVWEQVAILMNQPHILCDVEY